MVLLGDNKILMATNSDQSADEFRKTGLEVIQVDISEFEKLDGCVTCLSVRIRQLY